MHNNKTKLCAYIGLVDCCPRCGEVFSRDNPNFIDEESQRNHLLECMDDEKCKAFQMKRFYILV